MRGELKSTALFVTLIAGLGVGLSACDEAEQGRILMYEKGTYLGQPDTAIPAETQSMLKSRAAMQRGV
jgi:hypothetical protein